MEVIFYPDREVFERAVAEDVPLMLLVARNGKRVIVSTIDTVSDFRQLLVSSGFSRQGIDRYFRAVVNRSSALLTFSCPKAENADDGRDLKPGDCYKEGIRKLVEVCEQLNYEVPVEIPLLCRRRCAGRAA
jgi:hypothetical protein